MLLTHTHFFLARMFFESICLCLADLNIVNVVTTSTCYGQMVNIQLLLLKKKVMPSINTCDMKLSSYFK